MSFDDQVYMNACDAAAIEQGLQPVMEALDVAAIEWALYQSGGFCMILTVWTLDGAGEWGITRDEDEWVLVWYENGIDADNSGEYAPVVFPETIEDVINAIKERDEVQA